MSSLTLSGVVLSLRITLALPVTVATLPIGSSGASAHPQQARGSVAAVAGAAGWVGSVCTCASCVDPEVTSNTSVAPIIVPQASSASAKDNWRGIGEISVHGDWQKAGPRFQRVQAECGMNAALVVRMRANDQAPHPGNRAWRFTPRWKMASTALVRIQVEWLGGFAVGA